MSATEKPVEKAFTPKAIIVGIIGSLALVFADAILGPTSGFVATAEVSVMTVVILALIQLYTNIKFTFAEYVVIYAMVYGAAATYPGWFFWVGALVLPNAEAPAWLADFKAFVPSWLTLPKHLYEAALPGGQPTPFGELFGQFIVGFVLILVLVFISIFGLMPMRRQIVEIQRLPYPATTAAFTAVSLAVEKPPDEKVPLLGSRRNWLLFGLFIGFITVIFTEGYLVSTLWPGVPVIPGHIGDTPGQPGILWSMIPGAAIGLDMASVFPWSWFGYFAPMDALITIMITMLIVNFVVVPFYISAGIIEFDPSAAFDDIYFDAWYFAPYKLHPLGVALLAGGVIGAYIAAWKYIAETLKDKNPEYDFVSPQMQWILSFVAVIILTGIGIALGAPAVPAFLLSLFLIYVLQMWGVMGLGYINLQYTWDAHASSVVGEMCYAAGLIDTSQPSAALVGFTMQGRLFTRGDIGASAFFESSRFAFLGRVNSIKTIIIAIIIGLVIGSFGGQMFEAYLTYSYGINHDVFGTFLDGLWVLAIPRARNYVRGGFTWYGPSPDELGVFIILLLLAIAIPILQARVAFTIPFIPIVAGLTVLMSSSANIDWGWTFLPILIIKWLVVKIGGTKLDEQVARPFFAGAAAGGLFGAVVSGIGAAIKAMGG